MHFRFLGWTLILTRRWCGGVRKPRPKLLLVEVKIVWTSGLLTVVERLDTHERIKLNEPKGEIGDTFYFEVTE